MLSRPASQEAAAARPVPRSHALPGLRRRLPRRLFRATASSCSSTARGRHSRVRPAPAIAAPTDFECSGPLPALSPGRRVLEISAVDQVTGLESSRNQAPLTDRSGQRWPSQAVTERGTLVGAVDVGSALPLPSTTCAAGTPADCFAVAAIATDIAPVRRLLPLPDGRRAGVAGERRELRCFPRARRNVRNSRLEGRPDRAWKSRTWPQTPISTSTGSCISLQRPALRMGGAPSASFACANSRIASASRRRSWRISPPHRLAIPPFQSDRIGRIYLAMPGRVDNRAGYGGHILRFTRDGRAAGNGGIGSPILAQGRAQPARLVWDAAVAAADRIRGIGAPHRSCPLIPADAGSVGWPRRPIAVEGTVAACRMPD